MGTVLRSRKEAVVKFHLFVGVFLGATLLAGAQPARSAPKVALVNIQDAMLATTDGQNAAKDLDAQFGPRKATLDAEQKVIADLQGRLQQEGLKDADREALSKEINEKTVILNVKIDQADKELDAAQKKVLAELGKKMVSVIVEYANSKGYAMVFDISTSQAPLLYADNATDITSEVISAYEGRQKSAAIR